jgi:DNA polymerase III epsilon subunit-like protein
VIKTPECEKLSKVSEQSQKIGEFLDWLEAKSIVLSQSHEHTIGCYAPHDHEKCKRRHEKCERGYERCDVARLCGFLEGVLVPINVTFEKLLAEFYGIDLAKVERERRAMLASLAAENALKEVLR